MAFGATSSRIRSVLRFFGVAVAIAAVSVACMRHPFRGSATLAPGVSLMLVALVLVPRGERRREETETFVAAD